MISFLNAERFVIRKDNTVSRPVSTSGSVLLALFASVKSNGIPAAIPLSNVVNAELNPISLSFLGFVINAPIMYFSISVIILFFREF